MYSVNVLPLPGVECTRISPPSRRAISRLIERPRPVPPYLRDVVPSACWNASKISRSLSSGIPIPLSMTENASTVSELASVGAANCVVSGATSMRIVTPPCSVNFIAFETRFLSTCWSRCSSVTTVGGTLAPMISTASSSPLSSAIGRNVRST